MHVHLQQLGSFRGGWWWARQAIVQSSVGRTHIGYCLLGTHARVACVEGLKRSSLAEAEPARGAEGPGPWNRERRLSPLIWVKFNPRRPSQQQQVSSVFRERRRTPRDDAALDYRCTAPPANLGEVGVMLCVRGGGVGKRMVTRKIRKRKITRPYLGFSMLWG